MKMVEPTLKSIVAERPVPQPTQPQRLCMDKGYDFAEVDQSVARYGYTPHIRSRCQERKEEQALLGCRARRSVVEHSHSCAESVQTPAHPLGQAFAQTIWLCCTLLVPG